MIAARAIGHAAIVARAHVVGVVAAAAILFYRDADCPVGEE